MAPLGVGESREESFGAYSYACSGTSDTVAVLVDKDNIVTEGSEANNSFSESWMCIIFLPPMVEIQRPDLIVENIWRSGGKFYYRVKNQGSLNSAACSAQLYINGVLKDSDSVPALAAGASADRMFAIIFICPVGTPYNIEVRVDTGNTNAESNEGNNVRTVVWVCGDPMP